MGLNCTKCGNVFRDSRGPILCAAEKLLEKVEGGGDIWSFMEFDEDIKECIGAGLLTGLH